MDILLITSLAVTASKPAYVQCPENNDAQKAVYIPDPTDHSRFYKCTNETQYLLECPSGLEFNHKLNICDYSESVESDESRIRKRPSHLTSTLSTTPRPIRPYPLQPTPLRPLRPTKPRPTRPSLIRPWTTRPPRRTTRPRPTRTTSTKDYPSEYSDENNINSESNYSNETWIIPTEYTSPTKQTRPTKISRPSTTPRPTRPRPTTTRLIRPIRTTPSTRIPRRTTSPPRRSSEYSDSISSESSDSDETTQEQGPRIPTGHHYSKYIDDSVEASEEKERSDTRGDSTYLIL